MVTQQAGENPPLSSAVASCYTQVSLRRKETFSPHCFHSLLSFAQLICASSRKHSMAHQLLIIYLYLCLLRTIDYIYNNTCPI